MPRVLKNFTGLVLAPWNLKISRRSARLAGIVVLFAAISWGFYIHIPTLSDGHLNAGDDHVHVAFSNELARIWEGEGRFLGWSRLYATGSPIFTLRPPGFYTVTALFHFISGLTVEQSEKLLVLFGFCLYPLTIFIGARLLGLRYLTAVVAGVLAPLPISLWGHTIDAYQYLGVHKQLIAILLFPIVTGALWRLLQQGQYGLLFALSFAGMFMAHPYIAYCFTLLTPCMLIALATAEKSWNWCFTFKRTVLWSLASILIISIWMIPFVTSGEVQPLDPFLSRRNYFDVIVCTTAETLRQLFLGGILDTTKYSGPFGGTEWIAGAEWGWRKNDAHFRIPLLSAAAIFGWLVVVVKPVTAVRGFMSLAFLVGILLLMGPDDFSFMDMIPFAKQFQNIHAIFLFDWAAIMLGAVGISWLIRSSLSYKNRMIAYSACALVSVAVVGSLYTCYAERTLMAKRDVDVRNIYSANGHIQMKPNLHPEWKTFNALVETLKASPEKGGIGSLPQAHDDAVLYNLLPLMVDQPVYSSGFETVGGVRYLLLHGYRSGPRDSYPLQKLFNIRYVVNSHFHRKEELQWHDHAERLYRDKHWELIKVKGDFGELDQLPVHLVGFEGTEREWMKLMRRWLRDVRDGSNPPPWIINLSYLEAFDFKLLKPQLKLMLLGKDAEVPNELEHIEHLHLDWLGSKPIDAIRGKLKENLINIKDKEMKYAPLAYKVIRADRLLESFRITIDVPIGIIMFKRTYYRGWLAKVDDRPARIYRVSPGLQMILVPEGEHVVSWHYTGPNNWKWAKRAFWSGLLLLLILRLYEKIKPQSLARSSSNKELVAGRLFGRKSRYLPSGIWLLFIGIFLFKAYSEVYRKIPVTVQPRAGEHFIDGTVDFYWNLVIGLPKIKQNYEIQVATDKRFKDIIQTKTQDSGNHARISRAFLDDRAYYYRIRLLSDEKNYPWTSPIKFYGIGRS